MADRVVRQTTRVGDRYGRWEVEARATSRFYGRHEHRVWLCRCDCGTVRQVAEPSLRSGSSTSCGCYTVERSVEANSTHGHVNGKRATSEYTAWQAMNARCRNPNNPRYASYGGRGIAICERWKRFENFWSDMGPKPSKSHQLDRVDNDRGYEPGNCRWATPAVQMVNRRVTRFVEVDGKQVPLAELARLCGIPANTLRGRIVAGWDITRATSTPLKKTGPRLRL